MYSITEFDLQTYDHFKSVTSPPSGFTDNIITTYKYFYYPGSTGDLPSWLANSMHVPTIHIVKMF